MSDIRRVIREAIQQVLREHVKEPFLLLREIGLQARLWSLLRENLVPAVVKSQIKGRNSLHRHTGDFQTSRVQLELKVGGTEKSDIVVFRADRSPWLTCWPTGPTEVVARIDPDDVEAVIEMKAASSQDPGGRSRFVADIKKVDDLRAKHNHVQCYFVVVDKSLSVPGAVCEPSQADENWPLDPLGTLRDGSGDNGENLVEVWDLACGPAPIPRVRYLV